MRTAMHVSKLVGRRTSLGQRLGFLGVFTGRASLAEAQTAAQPAVQAGLHSDGRRGVPAATLVFEALT